MIRLGRVGPEVDRKLRFDTQDVAPLHGPVVGEFLPLQQAVNQEATLVLGVRVQDELPRLDRRGQLAQHVQISATDEHRVGAKGRLHAQPR